MLTRLEVNGFKNLLDFKVDFGPFTCIAGPNGVGKSNIFDAIRFLALLSDHEIFEAALQVRDTDPETGSLLDLFWTDGSARLPMIELAAEMLIEPEVVDDFGRPARASSSYLRYEVAIGYKASTKESMERLILQRESLNYITESQAARQLRFPHSARQFRSSVVHNARRAKTGYISTEIGSDGHTEILIHQEGNAGRPPRAPAETAHRTIVATSNTSITPTILAARREMQNWRLLALEPSAMRKADRLHSERRVGANGEHLPGALYRLANANADGKTDDQAEAEQQRVYARVAGRLAELVPIRDVRVTLDPVRQLLTLEVQENDEAYLPARSLSDGTLRFLTLCLLAEDPQARGLVCMEEPENGIHPARMEAMVDLLRELAVDGQQPIGPENPLRQVIVASHSPVFVQLQNEADLLLAAPVRLKTPQGPVTTLRCRPLQRTWRAGNDELGVGKGSIEAYLTKPPGAQIELPMEVVD